MCHHHIILNMILMCLKAVLRTILNPITNFYIPLQGQGSLLPLIIWICCLQGSPIRWGS